MSLFALIIILLVCFFHAIIGLFVYFKNPRGKTNIWFFLFTVSLVLWLLANYYGNDMELPHGLALLINRCIFLFSALGIFFLCRFSASFSGINISGWKLKMLDIAAITVAFASLTPLIARGITENYNIYEIDFGSFAPLFFAFIFIYFILSINNLLRGYVRRTGMEKQRSQYVMYSLFLGLVVSIVTNGILPSAFDIYALSALGPISTIIISAGFCYAIIKHQLFDIRIVVARAVAYFLLLTVLGSAYILGIIAIGGKFFGGESPGGAQQVYNIVLILIIALTLQPLRRFFEKITDSIFYRDHYDPQVLLNDLGTIMAREIELEKLTDKFIRELTEGMKLSKVLVTVIDKGEVFYQANSQAINFRTVSLDELGSLGEGIILKSGIDPAKIPDAFKKYGIEVSVKLRSKGETVGYLLLGEKQSGDTFNSNDVKLLRILSNELAIAIQNAKSYTQIQSFNKTLQIKVDEATKQLRDANEDLKRLDGIKNEFLSMATHQLNTPLTVVDGYLAMINDGIVSNPSEARDYLEKSLHRVRYMKGVVADFLNISHMESGRFSVEISPVDFNKLVTEEVNDLGPTAKEKGVFLQFIAPEHPVPIIEVDEQKTRQAVMNLIDNAIYYSPKGTVKVYLYSDDQFTSFKVVDDGIGVPANQKSKLFKKFARADNAKRERPNGTGVGLYLVKRVVEEQGGSIIFDSTEGKGSTFGFRLPIKEIKSKSTTPTATPELVKEKAQYSAPQSRPKPAPSPPPPAKTEESKKPEEPNRTEAPKNESPPTIQKHTEAPAIEEPKEPPKAEISDKPKKETSYYKIYG